MMEFHRKRITGGMPCYTDSFGVQQHDAAKSRLFELYKRQITVLKSTFVESAVYKNRFLQAAFVKLAIKKFTAGNRFAFPDDVFEFFVCMRKFLIVVRYGIKFSG